MKKKTPQEAAEEYVAKISERQNVSYLAFIEDIKIDYIAGYEQAKKNLLEGAVEGWMGHDDSNPMFSPFLFSTLSYSEEDAIKELNNLRHPRTTKVVPVRILKVEA